MGWLSRFWSRGSAPAAPRPVAAPAAPQPVEPEFNTEPTPLTSQDELTTQSHALLPWLLASPAATESEMSQAELQALDALDKTLALPELPGNLLPRAAALVPQLIAMVRQTALPIPEIAGRVSKDAVLAAELMRLASSPYYRSQAEVANLEQAIALVGLQGLQTVIARVLLKPIYQASPGRLSARAATRLWEHSEALARHTGILAGPAGISVFDAYLAGMLHDTGWTVALCVLDRADLTLPLPPSMAFVQRVTEKSHRLFGLAAQGWDITPGFTAFAQDARRNNLTESTHPLTPVLQWAQQRSMDELAPP